MHGMPLRDAAISSFVYVTKNGLRMVRTTSLLPAEFSKSSGSLLRFMSDMVRFIYSSTAIYKDSTSNIILDGVWQWLVLIQHGPPPIVTAHMITAGARPSSDQSSPS